MNSKIKWNGARCSFETHVSSAFFPVKLARGSQQSKTQPSKTWWNAQSKQSLIVYFSLFLKKLQGKKKTENEMQKWNAIAN